MFLIMSNINTVHGNENEKSNQSNEIMIKSPLGIILPK